MNGITILRTILRSPHSWSRGLCARYSSRSYCTDVKDTSNNIESSESTKRDNVDAEKLLHEASVESIGDEHNREWLEYNKTHRDQARHSYRPNIDPRNTSIILFPGQGSQFVGMAKELVDYPNVLDMFSVANKILGYDLLDLCVNGPKSKLDKTVYCQPAVFVTSLAAVEKLKHEKPWV